jgi:hypothetical protein
LALSNEIPIRFGETQIDCTAFGTGLFNIVHCKKPPLPFKCENARGQNGTAGQA